MRYRPKSQHCAQMSAVVSSYQVGACTVEKNIDTCLHKLTDQREMGYPCQCTHKSKKLQHSSSNPSW